MDDAKAKWSNLRITFKTNLNKFRSKKSGQGTDELVTIHWRYFDSLMFIEANDVQQSSESTSSLTLASANTDMSVLEDFPVASGAPAGVVGQRRKRTATSRLTSSPLPSPTPSSANSSLREAALHALVEMKEQDEYSLFGEFVASELRSLRARYVKRKLTRSLMDLMDAEQASEPLSAFVMSTIQIVGDNMGLERSSTFVVSSEQENSEK